MSNVVTGGLGQPGSPIVAGGLGIDDASVGGSISASLAGSGELSAVATANASLTAELAGTSSFAATTGDGEMAASIAGASVLWALGTAYDTAPTQVFGGALTGTVKAKSERFPRRVKASAAGSSGLTASLGATVDAYAAVRASGELTAGLLGTSGAAAGLEGGSTVAGGMSATAWVAGEAVGGSVVRAELGAAPQMVAGIADDELALLLAA